MFFFLFFFFSRVLKIFFWPRLPGDFLLKLLCKKHFFGRLGVYPTGPLFFFSCLFFPLFFHFRFLFQFLSMLFLFFLCFSFFNFYSFIFLLFSFFFRNSSFFMLFLFFLFSGVQNLWRHSWGKVHIPSWLYLLCIGSSSLFPVDSAHSGDDQVESRIWWVADGSSHTFAAESPDECARAVRSATPQSSLQSLSLFLSLSPTHSLSLSLTLLLFYPLTSLSLSLSLTLSRSCDMVM